METHPTSSPPAKRGFSLLVTLPLLLLLLTIATGFVALTSTTVRQKAQAPEEDEAQANARLALMLAIAELQKQLGPDRRVSAPAGILDESPHSLQVEGVAHPHWVGVWSTEMQDESAWVRDDREGGLSDRRYTEGYDREQAVLSYLVSGNEGGKEAQGGDLFNAKTANLGEDAVLLVGAGSVSNPVQQVRAPRIATMSDGKESGAYSYWVGDLGVQAHVGLVDKYHYHDPQRGSGPHGMERLVNAQDVESDLMVEDDPVGGRGKVQGQLHRSRNDRTFGKRTQKQEVKRSFLEIPPGSFHDLTTWSSAVLSNTRDGGLQRDLTAYLHSNGHISDLEDNGTIVSQGLDDADNIIGPANPTVAATNGLRWLEQGYRTISPKFEMLRRWHGIGSQLPWAHRERDAISPVPAPDWVRRGMNDGINVYQGGNLNPAGFTPLDTPNLSPVMVEGSLFYNLASYPTQPGNSRSAYTLRLCFYPRVALWNPFGVALETAPMVASIWVNGNKEVQVRSTLGIAQTVPIPFGRGSTKAGAVESAPDPSPAHHVGWVHFNLAPVTIQPGETLVFSPVRTGPYEIQNIFRNELSPEVAPDPSRYFWQDMEQTHPQPPATFIEFPGPENESGGNGLLMSLKDATPVQGRPTDTNFNSLPAIVFADCSLQAGANRELPVRWNSNRTAPVYRFVRPQETLNGAAIPDVRTRDGFRLRWWQETRSNIRGSGQLASSPRHFETSLLGTWNPRAAYFCRTPFDNLTDQPPYFFGMYTRDLFDEEVSWHAMMPRVRNGMMHGNPFGPPLEGADQVVLFEVPRAEIGIPSLGYLRHLKLSEFGWAPSYAIGNSLADPRVGRTNTIPILQSAQEKQFNGWNQHLFGWAEGRGNSPDYWAMLYRQILFELPSSEQVVQDLSYELNYNLWDDYFLSTGSPARKREFVMDLDGNPLPNGRIRIHQPGEHLERDLNDLHRAASRVRLEGGFNVHSVSKAAWKAVLASTIDTGYGSEGAVPYPRVLNPPQGEWLDGRANDKEALAGFRSLSELDLDFLAEEIVREVKERAPFFGLSDFINRRLVDHQHGEKGPLEAAISAAEINFVFDQSYPLDNSQDLPPVSFDNMADTTRLDQTLKPDSVAWGIPGYLTQGDVLQVIGSTLRPRSDTFIVRAYGESLGPDGKVQARAWCEAIVQRTAEPLDPDATGLNPEIVHDRTDLGRRFRMVSFRWLNEDEV